MGKLVHFPEEYPLNLQRGKKGEKDSIIKISTNFKEKNQIHASQLCQSTHFRNTKS